MFGLKGVGELSPVDRIESEIQSYVAAFLSKKKILLQLSNSIHYDIRTEAAVLLDTQKRLEIELNDALDQIEIMKKGAFTYSSIISLGSFVKHLKKHMDNVKDLEKKASGRTAVAPAHVPGLPGGALDTFKKFFLSPIGLVAVVGLSIKAFKK